MAEFPALTPSPVRVHEMAQARTGHRPCWRHSTYSGGLYWAEHFRVCTYCRSIHPLDLCDILEAGGARVVAAKKGTFRVSMPNPIAGQLVNMGSVPGHVFRSGSWPQDLVHRLYGDHAPLGFEPSISERLAGHFERPALAVAPAEIEWPLYENHVHPRQWADIWAAAKTGENNAEVQSTRPCDGDSHVSGHPLSGRR